MLVAHVEREGVWLVDGGMARLAEAMCELARSHGADFRFGRRATRDSRRERPRERSRDGRRAADRSGRDHLERRCPRPRRRMPRTRAGACGRSDAARRAVVVRHHLDDDGADRGIPAHPAQRFLLAGLPVGVRRYFCARAPALQPDRLCLRPGSRRRRPAATWLARASACSVSSTRPREPAGQSLTKWRCVHASKRLSGCLERCGLRIERDPDSIRRTTPEDFAALFPLDAGCALRPGDARLESLVSARRVDDQTSGSLSRGGQRSSGAGSADGGAVGPAGGALRDAGPCFDKEVEPGGYAWWYVDAISDDRRYGLTSSPSSAASSRPTTPGRAGATRSIIAPFNVALYGPARLALGHDREGAIGGGAEPRIACDWPFDRKLGRRRACASPSRNGPRQFPAAFADASRSAPEAINSRAFVLETQGRHWWRTLAPRADVTVKFDAPDLNWRGAGYFDQNAGAEPIERAFSHWSWSRAATRDGAAILYDAVRKREGPLSLVLAFDRNAGFEGREPPLPAALPPTRWGLARATRADDGRASARPLPRGHALLFAKPRHSQVIWRACRVDARKPVARSVRQPGRPSRCCRSACRERSRNALCRSLRWTGQFVRSSLLFLACETE